MLESLSLATVLALSKPDAPICKDKMVAIIKEAGWKGRDVRIAWSVSWRESNHRPDVVSGGAYGLFQLQNVHAGASWWDWDTILEPKANARMAYRFFKDAGWQPWGLTRDGRGVDASSYGGWDDWQIANWIWLPYQAAYEDFPKKCR